MTDLYRLMSKAERAFQDRLFAALAKEPGFEMFRPAYGAVLRNMNPKGSRITDIARRAGISKQGIGQLVAQMEEAGIVEIQVDPADARAKLVRIPPRNRSRHERVGAIVQAIARDVERKLGSDGVAELHRLLTKLAAD